MTRSHWIAFLLLCGCMVGEVGIQSRDLGTIFMLLLTTGCCACSHSLLMAYTWFMEESSQSSELYDKSLLYLQESVKSSISPLGKHGHILETCCWPQLRFFFPPIKLFVWQSQRVSKISFSRNRVDCRIVKCLRESIHLRNLLDWRSSFHESDAICHSPPKYRMFMAQSLCRDFYGRRRNWCNSNRTFCRPGSF